MTMTAHLIEQSQEFLELFLNEEMSPNELENWQTHYSECLRCQEYIDKSAIHEELLQEAEKTFQGTPSLLRDHLIQPSSPIKKPSLSWEEMQQKLKSTTLVLKLFSNSQLILEQSLQSRAAGIAGEKLPNVPLPESFLKESDVFLIFEENPLDHSLNIGLEGSSAKARLNTKLKVVYHSGKQDIFEGKTIAVGGMWQLEASKAKKIAHFELIYQGK